MYPDAVRVYAPLAEIDFAAMMGDIFTTRYNDGPLRLGNARKRVRIAPAKKRKARKAQRAARRNNR